jgi:hypothetical protein
MAFSMAFMSFIISAMPSLSAASPSGSMVSHGGSSLGKHAVSWSSAVDGSPLKERTTPTPLGNFSLATQMSNDVLFSM